MPIVIKEPLVSIVITSFNRSEFIEAAIQSALNQDYPNIEIVISDNHSTDNTSEILKKYTHDKRIKYFVNESNIGMIPNFKLATEQRTKGSYITYISSDDYLSNNSFISKAVSLINDYPNIVIVAAKHSTLYTSSNELIENASGLLYQNVFMDGKKAFMLFPKAFSLSFAAVLMHREKLIETKSFDSKAQSLDYEANLKLLLQGNIAFIKEPSYVFLRHSSQASATMNIERQINNLEFIENTYFFAKKFDLEIDLEEWREQVYYTYLNGIARRLIRKNDDLDVLMNHVKNEKKIHLSFFKSPKHFILYKIYRNYDKVKPLLKIFYPNLYNSIEKDI